MKKATGFSLIELIVVITIIAVVTAVGFVSFGGVNKKARDGRRMADLEKYRVALEMARQVGNTYPADTAPVLNTLVQMNLLSGTAVDPKTGKGYVYIRPTNYTYSIGATLEVDGLDYYVKNP